MFMIGYKAIDIKDQIIQWCYLSQSPFKHCGYIDSAQYNL